ncbi:outer membrane protein transport protein [Desulfobulbus rhabdoformis]|uniref:OmpP1/FadL family transporter n=1 Tax=Desulfobulbus rhabdoformis TaxID=34032 RepID=UPI0019662F17|nr:outer membrane protein transport protein [Desulfobulbus rhabdoformis]MBM9615581.1 outer membrane protein transport protein [Desulfobulbus rhabdoformis]
MVLWRYPQVWAFSYTCGILLAGIICGGLSPDQHALASGFRITNQSLGAVGKAGANTAYTPGPDASYYNPANMAFQPDIWQVETSLTTLYLPSVSYNDSRTSAFNGESESEIFYMPLLHLVSPEYGKLRFGFSLTSPFGLSKKWSQPFPRAYSQKISLITVEANPSLALKVNDWMSLGAGVRFIHGRGEIDNDLTASIFPLGPLTSVRHSSNASDMEVGYNLAMSLRPTDRWNIAATYRSEVELDLTGSGQMDAMIGTFPFLHYSTGASLNIILPAILSLSTSYSFDRLTVEVAWDRTFWGAISEMDFTYTQNFSEPYFAYFDSPITRNWKDTNAYRIGLNYDWNEHWTTTLGFAFDETPIPDQTLEFQLPDSDALVYCFGLRYRYSSTTEVGLSYMYHHTRTRSVQSNARDLNGTFTDGGAHAVTLGLITRF